jgi:hypothetical protein
VRLPIAINALDATHRTLGIADEAMACGQIPIRRDAEISCAGAAWIRRCVPRWISRIALTMLANG